MGKYVETPFTTFWRCLDLARAVNGYPSPTLGEAWGIFTGKGN